jgi:hypothetical protein
VNCKHYSGLVDGYCAECGTQVVPRIPHIIAAPDGMLLVQAAASHTGANPKTLTGQKKLPVLSIVPAASILGEAEAMRYGAFEAPRVDGSKGYGPYNWRDQAIEAMTYIDAALRHLMAWVDGEEVAEDSKVHHLKHAKASLGILLDAMELNKWLDNRPRVKGTAPAIMERNKRK